MINKFCENRKMKQNYVYCKHYGTQHKLLQIDMKAGEINKNITQTTFAITLYHYFFIFIHTQNSYIVYRHTICKCNMQSELQLVSKENLVSCALYLTFLMHIGLQTKFHNNRVMNSVFMQMLQLYSILYVIHNCYISYHHQRFHLNLDDLLPT